MVSMSNVGTKKRGRGRPRVHGDDRAQYTVRVDRAEHDVLEELAKAEGFETANAYVTAMAKQRARESAAASQSGPDPEGLLSRA